MPVWPKSFYSFGVSLGTAAAEWKLRSKHRAVPDQRRAFSRLVPRLAATSYWKAAGIEAGMTYEHFRRRVVPHSYARLASPVARMVRGEADLLWPGVCKLFALTAGTTDGTPRWVPMTDDLLRQVRSAGYDAARFYTVRVRHAGAFRGRCLLLGSAAQLNAVEGCPETFSAELSALAALALPPWADRHFYEPGAATIASGDFDARLAATVRRTLRRDIALLAGQPAWLIALARAVQREAGTGPIALADLWPNLECCIVTGQSVTPYLAELRAALGPDVVLHELYAATEAIVAAQDADSRQGLRLLADHGVFFEFLPLSDYDPARLEQLGPRAVPLADVRSGVDYVVLVTTPGGFARYVLGDIVRFLSVHPYRLVPVGGTELRLNAFGENVTEREVTEAISGVCTRHQWSLVNFHVAPLVGAADLTGQAPGRHEWWVELRPGTILTPTGPQMATELEAELQRLNANYAARRKTGAIAAPFVRLVMPGVFEHWQRFHRRWGDQAKIPRCRSDRLLADDLAVMTNFARD